MTSKEIKSKAHKAFNNKDYENCFELLWLLPAKEFYKFATSTNKKTKKQNWLTAKGSSHFFWQEFVKRKNVCSALFSNVPSLLTDYFEYPRFVSVFFEKNIASQNPSEYLEALIKNEVFYDPQRLMMCSEFLVSHKNSKDKLLVLKLISQKETELWNEISNYFKKLQNERAEIILINLVIAFETAKTKSNTEETLFNLGQAFSFIIAYLIKKTNFSINLSSEDFELLFIKELFKGKKHVINIITHLLNKIIERDNFIKLVDSFCYEDRFDFIIINNTLEPVRYPSKNDSWDRDGKRYRISENLYYELGEIEVDARIQKGLQIAGAYPKLIAANKKMAINRNAILNALEDLGITTLQSSVNKEKKPDLKVLVTLLQTFAFNRFMRYEEEIKKFPNTPRVWVTSFAEYVKNCLGKKENVYLPYIFIAKQELKNLSDVVISKDTSLEMAELIKTFSFRESGKKKTRFNRFNIKLDAWQRPFIEFNNFLFCPVSILTAFTGVYSFTEAFLKDYGRIGATEIESTLEKWMFQSNWDIERFDQKTVGQIDGDADLILHDEQTVILMQLKRSKQRLNMKDIYLDTIQNNARAAVQLNKAHHFFEENPSFFDLKNRTVHKWIVSTSFEQTLHTFDSCLKVSYQELVHSFRLLKSESLFFNNVQQFAVYVQDDTFLKNTIKQV